MNLLSDKVILVTGAARGIGAATAVCCAREGATVIFCDVRDGLAAQTLANIRAVGGTGRYIAADISDESSVIGMFKDIVAEYGRLDCAVNNAAIEIPLVSTPDVSMADFDRLMNINVRGTFLCLREELRIMREQRYGSVVNISSVAGLDGINDSVVYNASKHAVVGMTKCAAMDVGKYGVRVNSVAPGANNTEMAAEHFEQVPGLVENLLKKIPLARITEPSETAEVIAWLLSAKASYITGQTIVVDGGMLAGHIHD